MPLQTKNNGNGQNSAPPPNIQIWNYNTPSSAQKM